MRSKLFHLPVILCVFVSQGSTAQNGREKRQIAENAFSAAVRTKYGYIRGRVEPTGLAVFLGIPYAAPPVGSLRWKLPAEPKPWDDTLATTAYGQSCPQPPSDNDPTSEDCLYLNIFTTRDALNDPEAKKPVMFWIHGGGFASGSAKGYDGRELVKKGVVVVTINYRLGPFGYLFHPALEASEPNKGAGNYGLVDQITALKWVKQNISVFGGDPGNITVWGESAGAFSVGAILASPLAIGLFQKAILESGTGLLNGIQNKQDASRYATAGAKALGIEGADTNALKALYALSAEQLVEMYTRPMRPQLQAFYIWFSPVVDGWALPLPLDKAIEKNTWNNVPLLIGTNKHEGAYFQRVMPARDTAGYYHLLGEESLGDKTGILRRTYAVSDTSEIFERSQEVVGDLGFGAQARALARMATRKNGKAYVYYFTRTSKDSAGNPVKALHSTELPFVFGYTVERWQPYKRINGEHPKDAFLADAISDYWVSFARYGHPNGNISRLQLPVWPAYEKASNNYLEIGEQIRPMTDLRKPQYDAIDLFLKQKGEREF